MNMEKIGICAICGKEFARGFHQESKRYCSSECVRAAARANSRRFFELNKEKIYEERRDKRKNKPKKKRKQ